MDGTDFVSVRRPSDAPFRVLHTDLVSDTPEGYDLDLMRGLIEGKQVPVLSVVPLADGRFRVMAGGKLLVAMEMLIRLNKQIYDRLYGYARPARKVFAMIRCRVPASHTS